ncbi:uncharacterized protein LOC128041700 [Gossypium raimondii]|uniref:uncharacterized protein LOC128041700 n=1 Tax=Gossypium raimondii TaxID=29730 RepID=UPI00227CFB15|nr:uncharacterized protein LOC128041700 [Gossypium raimondii]
MSIESDRANSDEVNAGPNWKGRRLGQSSNTRANCSGTEDIAIRYEPRALSRAYIIRDREEATTSDVIAITFYLFDVNVYALIDPGSTHLYICTALVTDKNLSVESTKFDIQVTNPLGMDSLTLHDVVMNCRLKQIDLRCCKAFLAYKLDTQESESKLDQVPIVNDFTDVFPEELPGLPPEHEVEFVIELMPRTALVLIAPY